MAKISLTLILVLCLFNSEKTVEQTTITPTSTPTTTAVTAISDTSTTPFSLSSVGPELKECPTKRSSSYPITWPKTTDETPSQPPCVNQAKEILYRKCLNGLWDKEPECQEIQPEQVPLCPDYFEQAEDICYTITQRTIFPPSCPFKDVLPFYKFIDIVDDNLNQSVWMPITRDLSNGVEFLRWVEMSDFYKTVVTDYDYHGNISGKDCMVYDVNSRMVAVSCKEKHPAICAYQQLSLMENKVCKLYDGCHQSGYSSKSTCFCVEEAEYLTSRAEFIEPYQNSISLTDSVCNFGLQKNTNGTYYWSTSLQEIDYTFWSPDVIFDDNHIYGAVTPNGWILTKSLGPCFITEEKFSEQDVVLTLKFDNTNNVFVLTVTNPFWLQNFLDDNSLTRCFTNALRSRLLSTCSFDQIIDDVPDLHKYTFKPVEPFGGYYWCQAFKFSNSELVQSEKIFFPEANYFEFVALFRVTIDPSPYDLLHPNILEVLNKTVLSKLDIVIEDGTHYVPRIMEINDISEVSNFLDLNVHFSSTLELTTNTSQMEYQYNKLKSTISTLLYNHKYIKMLSFLSSNFCAREVIYYWPQFYLTWPTTPAFQESQPEEFCFRSDGNVVTNFCSGNFTLGFDWFKSSFECQTLPPSPLSKDLLSLQQKLTVTTDDMNRLLQMNVTTFITSDIYLYAEICVKYFTTLNFDFDLFIRALESVFKMNRRLLLQAQLVTRATDKISALVDYVMMVWQEPIQIVTHDFVLLSVFSVDLGGIAINGTRNLLILKGGWTIEKAADIEDLQLAITLGFEVKNQIENITKVTFSVFFNDALFGDQEFPTKNITAVLNVLFLNVSGVVLGQMLPGPISIIQKLDLNDNIEMSCVGWMSDYAAKGTWMKIGEFSNATSYPACNFWYNSYYAIASSWKEQNVTADLEDLLDEAYFDPERINRLVNISQKYDQFNCIDVFLVGRVLNLVKNNTDNDLNMVAKIIDNLHMIDKPVLAQSQEEHHATDLILYNLDNIIKNCNLESEVLITTNSFILFVSNLKTNVTGLLLFQSNRSVEARIVRDNFTISNITSYHNLSAAILLSPGLKSQWKNDSKIVITVFVKDVLFNEGQFKTQNVSKIFGVILPEHTNFTDPVTILQNISSSKFLLHCVHWNYSTNNQNMSFWKKDSTANSQSSMSQCNFWHTTHFALIVTNSAQNINYDVLDWIATINSALSLLGLWGIILTAILFEKWRRNIGNRILLNFSCAIIIQIVTFYLASTVNRHSESAYCTLIGVLLHYSIISQFCWMLTIAVLQFKRFVQVFVASPKYLLLKTCVCGWVFPLLPVMLALVLDNEKYVMGDIGLCYPSGLGLYLGIWVPIGFIGTINLVIFVYIIYSVFRQNEYQSRRDDGKHQWRLFILLFFMLGLTWIFGFLTGGNFGVVFSYLFCFTATLQGFVLFLYFIVFNVNTRYLYARAFTNLLSKK